jgi:phosphoadenosine phosphosulfate reductase
MDQTLENSLPGLLHQIGRLNVSDALALLAELFPGRVSFSTSFSFEDQVITHEILSRQTPIHIFTLDTGRMFPETYSTWNSTNERYNTKIKAYYPDAKLLESFIQENRIHL